MNQTTTKRSLRDVGASISSEEYLFLQENYKTKFPGEPAYLQIRKEVIQQVIKENPALCGIRFMYGHMHSDEATSKMLFLVPCYEKAGSTVPSPFLIPDGYLNHEGCRVSLQATWEYLNNYVVRSRKLEPNLLLRQISRTCFFGINQINELVGKEATSFIRYHFGFDTDENIKNVMTRYKIVLEPLDYMEISLDEYIDHAHLIPCPPGEFCCLLTTTAEKVRGNTEVEEELNIFRYYRDNILLRAEDNGQTVEMYYHISPLLIDKINQQPNSQELYEDLYRNYMERSKEFIENGDSIQARKLFETIMHQLMQRYLLN